MIFALERTQSALCLLSLEKISTGYRIAHFDKRLLNSKAPQAGLMHALQDMNHIEPSCGIVMGINDADLNICHIHLESSKTQTKLYQRCRAKLAQQLPHPLNYYSWDAYPLKGYQGDGHYCLCVAYPLEKIVFLQEILGLSLLRLQMIEPSVCALARTSLVLLRMSKALFLLYENKLFTLVLAIQGEVYAWRQFEKQEDLENNIASLPMQVEKIIFINYDPKVTIEKPNLQTIELLHFLQTSQGVHAEGTRLLPIIGLALRGFSV